MASVGTVVFGNVNRAEEIRANHEFFADIAAEFGDHIARCDDSNAGSIDVIFVLGFEDFEMISRIGFGVALKDFEDTSTSIADGDDHGQNFSHD